MKISHLALWPAGQSARALPQDRCGNGGEAVGRRAEIAVRLVGPFGDGRACLSVSQSCSCDTKMRFPGVEDAFARVAMPGCDAAIVRCATRNRFCVTAISECVAQSAVAATHFADCMTQSPVLVIRQPDCVTQHAVFVTQSELRVTHSSVRVTHFSVAVTHGERVVTHSELGVTGDPVFMTHSPAWETGIADRSAPRSTGVVAVLRGRADLRAQGSAGPIA